MRRLYAYDHRIYLLKCNSLHSFIACMDAFRPNNRSGKFIERFRLFSAQKSEQSLWGSFLESNCISENHRKPLKLSIWTNIISNRLRTMKTNYCTKFYIKKIPVFSCCVAFWHCFYLALSRWLFINLFRAFIWNIACTGVLPFRIWFRHFYKLQTYTSKWKTNTWKRHQTHNAKNISTALPYQQIHDKNSCKSIDRFSFVYFMWLYPCNCLIKIHACCFVVVGLSTR